MDGADVTVQMLLTTAEPQVARQIHDEAEAALSSVPGIGKVLSGFELLSAGPVINALPTPVRTAPIWLATLFAFEIIEALKAERDIIITKAVSWLLRSMVQHHKRGGRLHR